MPPGPVDPDPYVLILRDPRESIAKCSLTPLRGMSGIQFRTYAPDRRLDAGGRVLLTTDGELLGPDDAERGLLVIDCSWRRVPSLHATLDGDFLERRLPRLTTAYPRRSSTFEDPSTGLASVEALYAALALVGRRRPEILDDYYWRAEFLAANPGL